MHRANWNTWDHVEEVKRDARESRCVVGVSDLLTQEQSLVSLESSSCRPRRDVPALSAFGDTTSARSNGQDAMIRLRVSDQRTKSTVKVHLTRYTRTATSLNKLRT